MGGLCNSSDTPTGEPGCVQLDLVQLCFCCRSSTGRKNHKKIQNLLVNQSPCQSIQQGTIKNACVIARKDPKNRTETEKLGLPGLPGLLGWCDFQRTRYAYQSLEEKDHISIVVAPAQFAQQQTLLKHAKKIGLSRTWLLQMLKSVHVCVRLFACVFVLVGGAERMCSED